MLGEGPAQQLATKDPEVEFTIRPPSPKPVQPISKNLDFCLDLERALELSNTDKQYRSGGEFSSSRVRYMGGGTLGTAYTNTNKNTKIVLAVEWSLAGSKVSILALYSP